MKSTVKQQQAPRSIRLMYYLTQGTFWIAIFATIVISSLMIFVMSGGDNFLQKSLNGEKVILKTNVKLDKDGLKVNENYEDELDITEDSIINFSELPSTLKFSILLYPIIGSLIALLIVFYFRRFIILVYKGNYFDLKNIRNLKLISYILASTWLLDLVVSSLINSGIYSYVEKHEKADLFFKLEPPSIYMLITALLIWVLSHIFMEGLKLKQDNELNV